jgi:ribonucleotide reductase beta subunit family protein with ferritin-like domain
MEMISLRPKSNFFEVRVGEYQKANIYGNGDDSGFGMVDEF